MSHTGWLWSVTRLRNLKLIKHTACVSRFTKKGTDHICHNTLAKTPGSGNAEEPLFPPQCRNQLLYQQCFMFPFLMKE